MRFLTFVIASSLMLPVFALPESDYKSALEKLTVLQKKDVKLYIVTNDGVGIEATIDRVVIKEYPDYVPFISVHESSYSETKDIRLEAIRYIAKANNNRQIIIGGALGKKDETKESSTSAITPTPALSTEMPETQGKAKLPGGVIIVSATGSGKDKAIALKNAFREAITKAVGMYVSAEQSIKNDMVVEDIVNVSSDAVVLKYDIIDTIENDGIVQLTIKAQIVKNELSNRFKSSGPITKIDGTKVFADSEAKRENLKDCQKALCREMKGYPWSIVKFALIDKPRLSENASLDKSDSNTYTCTFSAEIDYSAYLSFISKLEKIISPVAESRDAKFDINPSIEESKENYFCYDEYTLARNRCLNYEENTLLLVKNKTSTINKSFTTIKYKLPKQIYTVLKDLFYYQDFKKALLIMWQDANGNTVTQHMLKLDTSWGNRPSAFGLGQSQKPGSATVEYVLIAPFYYSTITGCTGESIFIREISFKINDFKKINRCAFRFVCDGEMYYWSGRSENNIDSLEKSWNEYKFAPALDAIIEYYKNKSDSFYEQKWRAVRDEYKKQQGDKISTPENPEKISFAVDVTK